MEMNISIDEIRRRLELALRSAEPPALDGVLAAVERNGKLHGPVDWVFPAWRLYVDYVVKEVIGRFKPSAEEEEQLRDFGRKLNTLLGQAERQAKAKLASIYNAIMEGTYRMEGNRLYAPDGVWMYVRKGFTPHITIHGVTAKTRFPDVLKLPRERLELLQLGWRASDEYDEYGRPGMQTTQPWQVFAWTATRYGALYVNITIANLTHEGVSVQMHIKARSWRQRWSKAEAIDLVVNHFRHGEWTPLLTMWLGDGGSERRRVLSGRYRLVIAAKEPWRLGNTISTNLALVTSGKEAFRKLRDIANVYGELLDLLRAHKWINVKLAIDDDFRAAFKLKARRRNIDVLREMHKWDNNYVSTVDRIETVDMLRGGAVVVAGIVMYFELVSGRTSSLRAKCYVRDVGKALAIAGRLEAAGLRPNVGRSGSRYMVYIATADLLRLAEKDEAVRRAIALYLAEKAKNGTPRQRELAERFLQRHPLFSNNLTISSRPT
jgi:hypothetical protein